MAFSTEEQKLIKRAEQGDTSVLPALRQWLDANPGVWQQTGDLAWQVQESLIAAMTAEKNLVLPKIYRRKLTQMLNTLGWHGASSLEKLLIDRIVTTWLHCHYVELAYVQHLDIPIQRQDHYQRRIDRAHRRYLSSIRELARVRQLLKPTQGAGPNIIAERVSVAIGGPLCATDCGPGHQASNGHGKPPPVLSGQS